MDLKLLLIPLAAIVLAGLAWVLLQFRTSFASEQASATRASQPVSDDHERNPRDLTEIVRQIEDLTDAVHQQRVRSLEMANLVASRIKNERVGPMERAIIRRQAVDEELKVVALREAQGS